MKIKGVRLILHPGMPKCGSSSIQASLISNLDILRSKKVFILDKNFRVRDELDKQNPHGIPYSIIDECLDKEKDLEIELAECCRLIKEKHNIEEFDLVLSSEVLSFIGTQKGFEFHKVLNSIFESTLVIVIIRAPWNQMFSNWRQGDYRKGLSFNDYVEHHLKKTSKSEAYWESRIEHFMNLYGEVKIISLETSKDIIDDFYKQFLPEGLGIQKVNKRENRSLSPIFCEIIAKNSQFFQDEVNDVRYLIKRHKNILDDILPADSAIFSNNFLPIHYQLIVRLKNLFEKEYFSLLGKYGIHSGDELEALQKNLLESKPIQFDNIDSKNTSELMLAELVSSLKRI